MKPGFDFVGVLPIVLMFAVMYFLLIRPQSKKAKEHKTMVETLQKGYRVLTNGGLIGTILKVSDGEVEMEISPGVNVYVAKAMISTVLSGHSNPEKLPGTASPVAKQGAHKPSKLKLKKK